MVSANRSEPLMHVDPLTTIFQPITSQFEGIPQKPELASLVTDSGSTDALSQHPPFGPAGILSGLDGERPTMGW